MTIKIKTEKTVETNHEFAIPFFVMGACFAYKIIDETRCIQVCHGLLTSLSIGVCRPQTALKFDYGEKECTEAEFNDRYTKVQSALSQIVVLN